MHIAFLRLHNKIVRGLKARHPDWDSDKLFYEARKIVGGIMQKIVYGEFLPALLSPKSIEHLDLLGKHTSYHPKINPSIANVFASSAYRCGHSLIGDNWVS